MGNTAYIYGAHNGSEYRKVEEDHNDGKAGVEAKTHYDPRIHVTDFDSQMGLVQIGVVPPSEKEPGEWFNDEGQFLQLDRRGMARLIQELQTAAMATWGRDPW